MSTAGKNSVAAFLSGFVHVLLWVTLTIGTLTIVFSGIGLIASLNDGRLDIPFLNTFSEDVSPDQLITFLAICPVIMGGIIYICVQLRRILQTLAVGDPFVPENAPRLLRIAAAIAIMELARYLIVGLVLLFMDSADVKKFSVSIVAWIAAVALLVFSQVFREGSRLREEEKMTV